MLLKNHNKTAVIVEHTSLTYAQLLTAAREMADLIPASRERVMIYSENRPKWISACYACWIKDCTVVPVDYMAAWEEVLHIATDCTPAVILCSAQCRPTLDPVLEQLDYQPNVLIFEELVVPGTADPEPIEYKDGEQTALLIYTSGTTGPPKGVMLSFTNILANIDAVSHGVPIYTPNERVLMLLPLHHIFPLLGTMVTPLYVGATIAMSPSLQSEDVIRTLQKNKVTILIGVPRLYKLIISAVLLKIRANKAASLLFKAAEKIQNRAFSKLLFTSVHKKFGGHLTYLVSGGAALDPAVGQAFTTLGFEVLEGYGMTEAAPMITFTRPGEVHIGSVGAALPGTAIQIRKGEILAKGKNIMQGYWNNPAATKEAFSDGWLLTGDIGYLDEQARLFITGRKKEILVTSSGKNINPLILEQQLEASSPLIREAGIFLKDDLIQALIRPDLVAAREQGVSDLDAFFRAQVIAPFNQSVSSYQRIMQYTLVDEELPKTRLSKLKRFQLPDMAANRSVQKKTAHHPDWQEYSLIREYIESICATSLHPDDHLEIDLAMDSLDKVGLLVFLKNTFGVDIDETRLMTLQTPKKISAFVRDKKARVRVETINWQKILKEQKNLMLPSTWPTTVVLKNLSKVLFKCYFSLKGEGRENIPETPCILAPNHQSYFDGLFIASQLSNRFIRKTFFYAKEKHLKNKWIRSFADHHNVIVLDIHSDVKSSLQKAATLLRNGNNLMIFPEGTRTLDGTMGEFKKTFAILSKELNIPVVPVTINGAFEALPSGSLFPKPFKRISVTFQKPVFPTESHTYESIKAQVMDTINACLVPKKPC
ncbi:MAG: long-chain fatty acid--CoA ligase [Desulfobulbus propionicus]|nr:MAG: long-chain fatty acid--CoA ligase [Desulfobulbus propionicus]